MISWVPISRSEAAFALCWWLTSTLVRVSISELESWSGWLFVSLVVLLGYQQWRLYHLRRQVLQREQLFRIVAENAADMIALVDVKGKRLYNSPAYEKVLGYTPGELAKTPVFEQIHPDDRFKVLEASRHARETGVGRKLQYRMKHKNGNWLVLESAATTIKNDKGEVEQLVIVNRDITEKKQREEQAEFDSFHDILTGLPNRRLFLDRLRHCSMRAKRNPQYQFAILLLDVDRFKALNQELGATVGDQLLVEIARRLSSCLRNDDTVARPHGQLPMRDAVLSRMGGDEFTFVLENIKDPSDALRVAHRLLSQIQQPFSSNGRDIQVGASIGVAVSTPAHDNAENLLESAEAAMSRARSLGGARCEVFDEAMHTHAVNRLKLENELRSAIRTGEFRLHYQPIVHLNTKTIVGFEALVRWQHPEQGLISPYKFIDVAENVGLMLTIGNWVFRQACRQLHYWHLAMRTPETLDMAVNVSAKQFAHRDFVKELRGAIKESGIEPASLQLEISENIAMADPTVTTEVFSQLRYLGVRICIGDFGTGHCSLSWLRRLPIDVLKIDRSLISSMLSDNCSRDIVQLIIGLADVLSFKVVAEGIEGVSHLDALQKMGCQLGQGYYFSQPVDEKKAEQLLQQRSSGMKLSLSGRNGTFLPEPDTPRSTFSGAK